MYKYIFSVVLFSTISTTALAGRSGETTITNLIVKENFVEVYTSADGGCGTNPNRWHLQKTHSNYNAMFSGLLASKVSGKAVDIVGNNMCSVNDIGEDISWGYVVK